MKNNDSNLWQREPISDNKRTPKKKYKAKKGLLSNHHVGHFLEKIAIVYLWLKGYRLVEKNFVVKRGTGAGEIDLIMLKKKTLIFVEVKKRTTLSLAGEAVSLKNQIRTTKSAAVFLQRYPQFMHYDMRFDAILFEKGHILPYHIQDAWRVM